MFEGTVKKATLTSLSPILTVVVFLKCGCAMTADAVRSTRQSTKNFFIRNPLSIDLDCLGPLEGSSGASRYSSAR